MVFILFVSALNAVVCDIVFNLIPSLAFFNSKCSMSKISLEA